MYYQANYLSYRHIFSDQQKRMLNDLAKEYSLAEFAGNPRTFQECSIEYAFVSSKIEGNSYTLKDTVDLLKYGFTAGSKSFNDALMIKNINQAFDEICVHRRTSYPTLSKIFLCGLHETVSHGLMNQEMCGTVRQIPVTIQGSEYIPLSGASLLESELDVLLRTASDIQDVFERAVYVHLNLAYLQFFCDGNKRTARLMQAAVLADEGYVPLLMQEGEILEYQHSVVSYYETGEFGPYAELFLKAYKRTIDELLGRTEEQMEAQRMAEALIRKCRAQS